MVPWDMLPKDLQKAILAMIILYGGTRVCAGPGPMVCDPAPPPTSTPSPFKTPMICDPLPPPSRTATPALFKTPMICDPPPRPSITPTAIVRRHFQVTSLKTLSDLSLQGAVIKGNVRDGQGRPLKGLQVTAQGKSQVQAVTGNEGDYVINIGEPGEYRITVEGGQAYALPLELEQHDVVTIDWVEVKETSSQIPLPLAEIRSVDLVWDDGLTFSAESPWPDARLRWSVSGGTLVEEDECVTWQPPAEPGRYLLQVAADWGQAGLAVDALTLVVEEDGSINFG